MTYRFGFRNRNTLFLLFTILILQFLSNTALAASNSYSGKILNVTGSVEVKAVSSSQWRHVNPGTELYPGDIVRTGRNGKASLLMSDETLMQLNRNTRIQIKQVDNNAGWFSLAGLRQSANKMLGSVYEVLEGNIWARNKNKNVSIQFQTNSITAGIRGTELVIDVVNDDLVETRVLEGQVKHWNEHGSLIAEAGTQVITHKGRAPVKKVLLKPVDAVQWTIQLPAILDINAISLSAMQSAITEQKLTERIISLINKNKFTEARELLDASLTSNDKSKLMLDAVVDLYSGLPVRASEKLKVFTKRYPKNYVAWRYLAISELVINNKTAAMTAAKEAVQLNPDDASSLIILAYVYQAHFDLDSAAGVIKKVLLNQPDNISALLLLSQLQFGSNDTNVAWSTINKAQELDPGNADINNLAGFILIGRQDIKAAEKAFNEALAIKPGLAESYMGLSLVKMRQGRDLEALESITTAIALEPQRADFLSYWGKMLYQIKRFNKALDVFDHAEKLDPNDPTPAFYKSIILRDLNRPGEAIHNMNHAISLNDNRAVYRSRFLLDQDLAVRNVDLSKIFDQLGLNAWAQRKAVSAIKSDYMNSSGHLFLAGVLSEQDDRSYPFASEALLARLLQPANANTFNTFNNYTTLFEQPHLDAEISISRGNHRRTEADIILYGALPDNNFAYNFGFLSAENGGWRDTNFDNSDSAAFISKWDLSENHGLFFSALRSKLRSGDESDYRYEFDSPVEENDRSTIEFKHFEIGYNYKVSAESNFLAYMAYNDNESNVFDRTLNLLVAPALYADEGLNVALELPYSQMQLEFLSRLKSHELIVSGMYYDGESSIDSLEVTDIVDLGTNTILIDDFSVIPLTNMLDVKYSNFMLKDIWHISDSWIAEAAFTKDEIDNVNLSTATQWTVKENNHQLGLIWNISENQTIRIADFQYLLPFSSSRIDPIEIAGITMYRNTQEGSHISESNLTWEYEWSSGLFSTSFYKIDKELDQGSVVLFGEIDGTDISWNQLLSNRTGLSLAYKITDIIDESATALDRKDYFFEMGIKHVTSSDITAGLKQTRRRMEFDNNRYETVNITDFNIKSELKDKSGYVELKINNLFNHKFNWVTDNLILNGRSPVREVLLTFNLGF